MASAQLPDQDALEIVDLAASDMGEAVDLLARGMRDNPVHIAAYGPDPERRQRLIQVAFRSVFEHFVHQEPCGMRSDGKLVAVTGIGPPGTCRPTVGQRLRMAPTMVKFGPRAAARTGRWLSEWARHDPDEPHSHLGPLAVDRDLQRRGIGSVLLKEYCRRIDAAGEVGYLETDKPRKCASTSEPASRSFTRATFSECPTGTCAASRAAAEALAYRGQTIENPVVGDRVTFHATSADSQRRRLVLEVVMDPGANGTPSTSTPFRRKASRFSPAVWAHGWTASRVSSKPGIDTSAELPKA